MMVKDRRGLDDDGKLITARQNLQRAPMRVLATPEGECDGGCDGGEWEQVKISGEGTVVVEILVTST